MKVTQKKPVEASGELMNGVRKFLDALTGIFRTIADHVAEDENLDVKDAKKNKDGSVTLKVATSEDSEGTSGIFYVKMTPVDKEGKVFTLDFYTEDKSKELKKELVKEDKVNDIITQVADDWFAAGVEEAVDDKGNDRFNPTNSSRAMRVSLKRVTAGAEDEIHLTGIMANYVACEALDDLTKIISDDAFVATIGGNGGTFDIIDDGESYDVEPCECCQMDLGQIFSQMLTAAFGLYFNLKAIHWNSKGENFFELHNTAESFVWMIQSQIDVLAEMCVEKTGIVLNPSCYAAGVNAVDVSAGFTRDTGYAFIQEGIKQYVATLEMYYCNFDHDIQSVLDEWIRSWKVESDYKFKQYFIN